MIKTQEQIKKHRLYYEKHRNQRKSIGLKDNKKTQEPTTKHWLECKKPWEPTEKTWLHCEKHRNNKQIDLLCSAQEPTQKNTGFTVKNIDEQKHEI